MSQATTVGLLAVPPALGFRGSLDLDFLCRCVIGAASVP